MKSFKEIWYERNPVHENNSDTGEDMFWKTAQMVAEEFCSQSLSTETGQQELIKYVNESFNETARIYGKVKRVAQYGGSIFIIFEDDSCYRLQWQSYRNDTVTLDASQPQEGQDELGWKQEYDAAVNEIGQLQDQLKEAEAEIRSLQNELRNTY